MQLINNHEHPNDLPNCIACAGISSDLKCNHTSSNAECKDSSILLENSQFQERKDQQTILTFPFYEKIKKIWINNGKKKHKIVEKVEQKNIVKQQDFSFSPYDNFF